MPIGCVINLYYWGQCTTAQAINFFKCIISFFISVVDTDSSFYKMVLNQTLVIEIPPEATAFDTQTLLTIGGMLLLVQAIVVIRRRRKKEE